MHHLDARPAPVRPARHGQAPVWDDRAGELLWVDRAGEIRWAQVDPAGRVRDLAVRQAGEPVAAVAPTMTPGWLLAAEGGFRGLPLDGQVRPVLDITGEGAARPRICHGACDPVGRFFAGTDTQDRDRGTGALYRVDLDGVVGLALTGLTVPAGVAWSPQGDVLYLADSGSRTVTAYEYDVDLGTLGLPRSLLEFAGAAGAAGAPAGLTVDLAGHIWLALWGSGLVHRYSSAGRLESVVRVPASQVTGCTFAGPDLDTLVVTTSTEGLSGDERAAQPHAGRLFTTRAPDVIGRPASPYRGPLRGLTGPVRR
jgi:sugar lactone lactonase YvrE